MENWNRRKHFDHFRKMDYPHFNLCATLDITEFLKYTRARDMSFFLTFLYSTVKAANKIPEFRYRIREDQVIEHQVIHPSFTVMTKDNVFAFCPVEYKTDFIEFYQHAAQEKIRAEQSVCLEDEPGRDDALYVTSMPWVSFTGVTHPIQMSPVDSIPRIAWGKYFVEHDHYKIPLSIQVHHAVVDGSHVGAFFTLVQEMMNEKQQKVIASEK